MTRRVLLTALTALLIGGCAGMKRVEPDTFTRNSVSFEIGRVTEKRTGDAIAVEENLLFYEAPVATSDFQPPPQPGASYPLIRTGTVFKPYGRLASGVVLYSSDDLRPRTSRGDPVGWEYCIAVDASGEAYGDAACALGLVRAWSPRPEGFLELRTVYRKGSFRRELVYNGKAGSVIQITYREYRGGLASPSESQDLVYDLSESGRIRFRGMEIDVQEATNGGIRFIVLSPMGGTRPGAAINGPLKNP